MRVRRLLDRVCLVSPQRRPSPHDVLVAILRLHRSRTAASFACPIHGTSRLRRGVGSCKAQFALGVRHRSCTFALYLESESAGQVQFRRLDATHPQGVRCRRAALDNVKPHGPRMQVVDVYKIENHVVLERFQSVVASLPSPKVKGLFCSVPVAAIERCVAFGMTGDSNPPVFRASWYSNTSKYAQPVATAAAPIQFPKRFSRYSSFDTANSHRCHHETTTQFLALCRVVMQQVAIAPAATSSPFPSPSIDTMYFNAEEEYLVRHGHYVVPEFLIQLEIDEPVSTQVVPLKGTATSTSGLQGENDLAPVLELALLGPHDQLPRPTAFPFESVVAGINNVPAAAPVGPSKGLRKMKPELFGTTAASDCPPTTPDFHVKKQWLLVRTSVVHATVGALHQFWDRMGQAWHLRYRNHNTSSMIRHSNNQLESGDTTVPLSDTKAWSGKAKSVKAKLKAAIIATSGSPYCVGR
ncbi:hypothetical protein, variant 1 [Aphanomyces astaci]|uniref:Uncharacterized protein n=1 Tax=Aphanomyces astaci TaxID=112090 RepID=W4G6V3_APHAT|nr:hypothetical protein, variant 1 [Aphanomyces astaci]ETV75405.1 hypothetical protein, variant 1 [Aphanomyces astaci]|eukprot:XP_009835039.1 hypothetical protein, variant 1 [Aphanomyces astaci]